MKKFLKLIESILNEDDVEPSDEFIKERDQAFAKMANTQRNGEPEKLGTTLRIGLTDGIYGNSLEHIGDLTHRLGENFSFFEGDYAIPKIKSQLRYLTNEYGYRREVIEQIISNNKYNTKNGKSNISDDEAIQKVKDYGKRYAEAHAKIPVYNELQWRARQAAIDLGNWNFRGVEKNLQWLKDIIERKEFRQKAGEYNGEEYIKENEV